MPGAGVSTAEDERLIRLGDKHPMLGTLDAGVRERRGGNGVDSSSGLQEDGANGVSHATGSTRSEVEGGASTRGGGSSRSRYPLRVELPEERPPRFSGCKFKFHTWAWRFREYAGLHGFLRVVEGQVDLDISNSELCVDDVVRLGCVERDLEDAKIARWALLSSCNNRFFQMTVMCQGRVHEAWKSLNQYYSQFSASRMRTLMSKLSSAKLGGNEDPFDFLRRMEDMSLELDELGVQIPLNMVYRSYLDALPAEHDLEKQMMLTRDTLERSNIIDIMQYRFEMLRDEQSGSISGEALSPRRRRRPKNRSSGKVSHRKGSPGENGKPACYLCGATGHRQAKCPTKEVCSTCGGRGHGWRRCGTDAEALAISDSKGFAGEVRVEDDTDLTGMVAVLSQSLRNSEIGEASAKGMSCANACKDRGGFLIRAQVERSDLTLELKRGAIASTQTQKLCARKHSREGIAWVAGQSWVPRSM